MLPLDIDSPRRPGEGAARDKLATFGAQPRMWTNSRGRRPKRSQSVLLFFVFVSKASWQASSELTEARKPRIFFD